MDKEILFKIKKRLERLGSRSITEAGTKESFINPLISALGWDITDFDEVKLEYKHTKKDSPVDYALLIDMNPKLYIEAKQIGANLDDRKWNAQILTYATMAGVKWALLTDGNHYKLFNSMAEAKLEEKLFYEWKMKELSDLNIDNVLNFLNLLTKEKFKEDEIEIAWKNHFEVNKVKKAFERIVDDREEGLLNLIRKKTKLKRTIIINSLNKLEINIDKVHPHSFPLAVREKEVRFLEKPKTGDFTGTFPSEAILLGERFEIGTWRELMIKSAEKLLKINPELFNSLPDSRTMKGRKNYLLTKDKHILRAPHKLSNGVYLETNLSANSIVRLIKKRLLIGCGYKETDMELFLRD